MAIIKCKMCGGDLALAPNSTVCECEYCGTKQTVPSADNDKKLTLFARANQLRASCNFDQAYGIFETLVTDFPEEAEAYWGLVLCKYGIEYVDDPATGAKIPTCHRSSYESVLTDQNYENAMDYASPQARKVYREEANAIEQLRKNIIEVSAKADPYDIFICYKDTDATGQRTEDSVMAQKIYNDLVKEGYRVFFSRITLETMLGVEYEPYIFAALNSAKVMLVMGTCQEHLNAVWVRNEWSRYLKLMAKDRDKHLFACYKGMDPYQLPEEFKNLQALDLSKIGADQDLLHGVAKYFPKKTAAQAAVAANDPMMELLGSADTYAGWGDYQVADKKYREINDKQPKISKAWWGRIVCATKGFTYDGANMNDLNKWMRNVKNTAKPDEYAPLEAKYMEYLKLVSARMTESEDEILRISISNQEDNRLRLNQRLLDLQAELNAHNERVQEETADTEQRSRIARSNIRKTGVTKVGGIILFICAFFVGMIGLALSLGAAQAMFWKLVWGGLFLYFTVSIVKKGIEKFRDANRTVAVSNKTIEDCALALQRMSLDSTHYVQQHNESVNRTRQDLTAAQDKVNACMAFQNLTFEQRKEFFFARSCQIIGIDQPCDPNIAALYEKTQ